MPEPAVRSARAFVAASLGVLLGAGCIGTRIVHPVLPTVEELREFEGAGPVDVVAGALETGSMNVSGPYRVVAGDLLVFELPPEVRVEAAGAEPGATSVSFKCRVREDGTVLLPMVGDQAVAGKTTEEIEAGLTRAFVSDERLEARPNVVATVGEYRTTAVAVIGAVNQPGLHDLRSDRLTVAGALMAAGGIKSERGAKEIRILSRDERGRTVARSLGVHFADIPLEDVALGGGETLVVEPSPERSFSVIGLVKKSGAFPYPAPRVYNLMQALAAAGGVDEVAAPRYATVYRVKADGTRIGATFKIDGTSLLDASNVRIKDGDVIAVEHTVGSWLRQFLSGVLGLRASVSVSSGASPTL
jgi:protein involved in polysaccharide export with SLBB domain